ERSAGVGAHREAIAYYGTALRHADQMSPEVRGRLLDSLAYERLLTGELEGAIDARRDALGIWRASGSAMRAGDTLRALSRLQCLRGDGEQARRYATEAIAALEPLGSTDELAMAFSNMAQLTMLASHDAQAVAWSERAIDLA